MLLINETTKNTKTNKNQTNAEHFIDKKAINKNFKLVASYYPGRYPIQTRRQQDKSLSTKAFKTFFPLFTRSINMFSPQSRLRHAVADTFAMVVYCSVVNMLIEIFLSGMSFEQSLYSRLVAIPVNILIAWPYGMYRDLFMRAARKATQAGWAKNLADVLAYVTFQSPVYVIILLTVGADWHQITAAVSSNIVVSMLMGAVYGYFLDYCRRLFKVSSYHQAKA
jgi:hypothetical protein